MYNLDKKTTHMDFDAEIIIVADSTIGDKVKALRLSKKITLAALSRASGLTDRAIRYIENNEHQPGVDAIKKLSAALEVGTDYFMDDALFQEEVHKEELLKQAKEKYGSRGKTQALAVYESVKDLYAGRRLNKDERDAFHNLTMEIFFDSKEAAKKFTPKKYRKI